jgi:membrane-bound lytic murein transglycosylase F
MLGSYNAGRGTVLRAQKVAQKQELDPRAWQSIETVAPAVSKWRHEETLAYISRIEGNLVRMEPHGPVVK